MEQARMTGVIRAALKKDARRLLLTARGPDAPGLIAGLARVVDEKACSIDVFDFVSRGLKQDEYYLIAAVTGDKPRLLALRKAVHGKRLAQFVEPGLGHQQRPATSTGTSALYLVTVDCPDRIGILDCAANAIAARFGNFVWLRADTYNTNPPEFRISALATFNKALRHADIEGAIRRAFRDRDKDDARRGLHPVVELHEAQVGVISLR
jgi:glycine cleavage system regulatory protein